ncbi:MAG: hypothetical protein GYB32_07770 [Algicola sp.]|nr:hypothetical protein [Algicola sp.]
MVILKKIQGSTLMETLIATVLIMVIFIVSSLILNNVFMNTMNENLGNIKAHLNELEYQFINDKLTIPYYDDFQDWEIHAKYKGTTEKEKVIFSALNTITGKQVETITYR